MGRSTVRGPSAWGGGDNNPAADAPSDAGYVVTASNGSLTNETLIGSIILPGDTLANRPSATGLVAGTIFSATDAGFTYRADGAGAWETIIDLTSEDVTVTGDVTTTGRVTSLPDSTSTQGQSTHTVEAFFDEVAPARTAIGRASFTATATLTSSSASVALTASDGAAATVSFSVLNNASGEFASLQVGGAVFENDNNELGLYASGDLGTGKYTQDGTEGLILYSPNATAWRVTVTNLGVLMVAAV